MLSTNESSESSRARESREEIDKYTAGSRGWQWLGCLIDVECVSFVSFSFTRPSHDETNSHYESGD